MIFFENVINCGNIVLLVSSRELRNNSFYISDLTEFTCVIASTYNLASSVDVTSAVTVHVQFPELNQ